MAKVIADSTEAVASSLYVSAVDALATSLGNVAVQNEPGQIVPTANAEKTLAPSQPMRIYTRAQILFLSKSPMVLLPPGMPELKDWFGSENEQNLSKKESEPTTPGSARERRFRRDIEDGETPPRPSFRSTLSQPSQMGNFKHQSLRASDRERDTDKDRERDTRDKDGLRHLSDKYDRDRLALPLSARNKERDTAPHLSTGSTSRLGQAQGPPGSSRRTEARDAIKKKAGEASEDWRKGPDLRSVREDRTDNGRKDRDDRERARSRGRDSSRPRREPSPSRRGERDDYRRDRERDLERDGEDDPRRWRDDGKRDERMAARRAERLRDKESTLDPADRRWVAAEDRDSRAKRPTGRDRKAGPTDDGKDRDDRRDREREKEPAWMDTYIPPSTSGGILSGKTGDGGLDGIQAWKKERKEKEMNDQGGLPANTQDSVGPEKADVNGKPLDEIQLFRLLMKRERGDGKKDAPDDGTAFQARPSQESPTPPKDGLNLASPLSQSQVTSPSAVPKPEARPTPAAAPSSLLSLFGYSKEPSTSATTTPFQEAPPNSLHDPASQFNPPPGSRVLAFARSNPAASRSQNLNNGPSISQNGTFPNPAGIQSDVAQQASKNDALRSLPGFSPFEEQNRASYGFEDHRDASLAVAPDAQRRALTDRHGFAPSAEHQFHDAASSDSGNGYSANKGSRFAKFFDAKGRESVPAIPKSHTPVGLSSSPGPGQRQDHAFGGNHGNGPDPRAMDEIYAMLSSSAQGPRGPLHIPNSAPMSSNLNYALQPQNNLHLLQQQQLQQQQQQQQQQQLHTGRLEPLYESRLDDRNFVPDGMVPGLRSVPPPRNRDNAGIYDEDIPFNVQPRLPPQQQRNNLEQLYPGGPMFNQQGGRNPSMPLQQNHYRGGPSPISHQHLQNPQQQRLPPGLANLGGRPPHEPSQFIGMPGMPSPGLHGALHLGGSNPQQQQPFNNFPPGGNAGYGAGPPIRGPHQLQNPGGHLPMGGLGHPSSIDLRTAGQNQLLGMGGVGGLRGTGGGFPGQQGPGGQIPPLLAMRQQQQQQQQLPPHLMPHLIPPHLQQQGPNSQPTHDLMALLMGNTHRE